MISNCIIIFPLCNAGELLILRFYPYILIYNYLNSILKGKILAARSLWLLYQQEMIGDSKASSQKKFLNPQGVVTVSADVLKFLQKPPCSYQNSEAKRIFLSTSPFRDGFGGSIEIPAKSIILIEFSMK